MNRRSSGSGRPKYLPNQQNKKIKYIQFGVMSSHEIQMVSEMEVNNGSLYEFVSDKSQVHDKQFMGDKMQNSLVGSSDGNFVRRTALGSVLDPQLVGFLCVFQSESFVIS